MTRMDIGLGVQETGLATAGVVGEVKGRGASGMQAGRREISSLIITYYL